ncbi:MAG: hypothetical protein ACYDHX_12175 [Methanothrix sp.]
MTVTKLVLCMITLFIISSPGISEWKDVTTSTAEVVAGNEALLESGVQTNLQVDGQNTDVLKSKSVKSSLIGADIYSANLASSEDLTVTDENGIVHQYSTATKQYITLPAASNQATEGYDVAMVGQSFYDFTDSFDITPELDFGLSVNDPELNNLLDLGISSDDSPNDIINKFLISFGESGLGNNMDRFLEPNNLMYGAEYERAYSDSNNGVNCDWGDSQKVSIDYAWLTGEKS